jgi:GNAT superfamily N-acetyltransferase
VTSFYTNCCLMTARAKLIADSPDTGRVKFSVRYHTDIYQSMAVLRPGSVGAVAVEADTGRLVGSGMVTFGECWFEGDVRPYALLNTLVVHPDFRRWGIASRLAQWRAEGAKQKFGDEGVTLAFIQAGNTGPKNTAKKWAAWQGGKFSSAVFKMLSHAPKLPPGLMVRRATLQDSEQIAEQLNRFYKGYNFYPPQTPDKLTEWSNMTVGNAPVHHYFVAVDSAGNLLAGGGLTESSRLATIKVINLPLSIRPLNKVVQLILPDAIIRIISALPVLCAPVSITESRFICLLS